jgi:soluble lytic murein transglycosylase-like protein
MIGVDMLKIMLLLGVALYCGQATAGTIYKFVDAEGHTYYTNKPKKAYRYIDSSGFAYYSDEPQHSVSKTVFKFRTYTSKDFPTRTIRYASINKKRFEGLIEQTASKYQIDPKLVHAVIQTESAYDADAVSSAGAVGLMQLMPATARRFGVNDRNDPYQNVEGGTRYLKHLINLFEDNLHLAVAAYNAGENAVMKYNYSIPPYPETQNYVRQVLALYKR